MSGRWRIEHADALALLRELPDGWAQTCLASPPAGEPGYALAVLGEVQRVLRDDGTLWMAPPRSGPSRIAGMLRDSGWLQPPRPVAPGRLLLFVKQPLFLFSRSRGALLSRYFQAPDCPRHAVAQHPGHGCRSCRLPRRAWCVPAAGAAGFTAETAGWCIAASTVPLACGVCGAPYQRVPSGQGSQRWRRGCAHLDDRGRCLVLDPFCSTASTGMAAVGRGRAFLGITSTRANARLVARRLTEEGRGR